MKKSLFKSTQFLILSFSLLVVIQAVSIEHNFPRYPQNLFTYNFYELNQPPQYFVNQSYAELNFLNSLTPYIQDKRTRATTIDLKSIQKVIDSTDSHPVVGWLAQSQYENDERGIGYCFGRAMYAHLMLLNMGLNKDSIKKVFALGQMKTASSSWRYHVTTIALADDGKWYSVDTFLGTPQPVETWYRRLLNQYSTDQKLRIYVTSAKRFSPGDYTYTKAALGLNLEKENDYYSHYFVDLLDWFDETFTDGDQLQALEDLGLPHLVKELEEEVLN